MRALQAAADNAFCIRTQLLESKIHVPPFISEWHIYGRNNKKKLFTKYTEIVASER